ncbi:MAG: tetratricopeptide repeat protein [Myxococcota bacterium]
MQDRTPSIRLAVRRAALLFVAGAAILVATGCVTTTTNPPGPDPFALSEAEAKRDLGVDYLSTNRIGMAIRELSRSQELDDSDPKTHLWLGEAFRRKGQTEVAENYLGEAIRLAKRQKDDETHQQAQLNLSALLSQLGRYEESLQYCEALAADPTISTPWRPLSNCGWALMKLGRLDEAKAKFEEALSFFPRFGPALLNLGILEAKQGHAVAAIRSLQKAIDSGRLSASGYAEANYRLGELFVGLGRRDKAVDHFKAAAKIAPDDDWGSQSQAYLDLLR